MPEPKTKSKIRQREHRSYHYDSDGHMVAMVETIYTYDSASRCTGSVTVVVLADGGAGWKDATTGRKMPWGRRELRYTE